MTLISQVQTEGKGAVVLGYSLEKDGKIIEATEEQAAIIDAALTTKDNILINALAGAAKTSTLEFLCKYLPKEPILSIAFNKRIAEEMGKRLPPNVKCATINSVGHRIWGAAIGPRLVVDKDKTYKIVKELVDSLPARQRGEAYEMFSDIMKLVGRAKSSGYLPDGIHPQVTRLFPASEFWDLVEEQDDELLWCRTLVDQALTTSIAQAYRGLVDFDDQIYMPTLFGGSFPQFPTVMVDEAQDLSRLNHAFLRKLARSARLFAVGDQRQSIYAFRGALGSGMSKLQRDFNMKEMTLSISFRCPVKIVENARFHAPHMQWAPWAIEGSITHLETWNARTVADNAAIICRNNAPLFSLAFKLLKQGRGVKLVGFDIGPALVKTLKKLGPETMSREHLHAAIDLWESEKLAKAKRGVGTIKDKAECLRVFADFGDTLGKACAYAEHLFATTGTIQLLSGHKAKGLEWDVVYHLDPHRIPSPWSRGEEDFEQERNVRYVIETRAKRGLFLVTMEGFDAP